jgi:hypothetical protein
MKIIDCHFDHAESAGSPYKNIHLPFLWERNFNDLSRDENIFFTDSTLHQSFELNHNNKILWALESPAIIADKTKKEILANHHLFKKILTHDDDLLSLPNAIHFPVGGCWIYENDCQVYQEKINRASLIISPKQYSYGQKLRHLIADESLTDNFGSNYQTLDYKLDALKKYKFHVCIENHRNNSYFSEKLIDCFATGTIPLYWGCKKLDKFFNTKGIIEVDNYFEMKFILKNLDSIQIDDKIIKENFELSKEFWLPEKRILKLFS